MRPLASLSMTTKLGLGLSALGVIAGTTTSLHAMLTATNGTTSVLGASVTREAKPAATATSLPPPPTTRDTTPPPVPRITSGPGNPTSDTVAWFSFTDAEAAATFECGLDKTKYTACRSGDAFRDLKEAEHIMYVRGIDTAGNASAATTWSWTVVKKLNFTISGSVSGTLAPGMARPIDLSLTNPYNFNISVDAVSVSISAATSIEGCSGTGNFSVSKPFGPSVIVPANATVVLSDRVFPASRPMVAMNDLPVNQDICKSATFDFAYAGTATKS